MGVDTNEKVQNLYVINGEKGTIGPITQNVKHLQCTKCGNTEIFEGVARVYPKIIIEKDINHYQVTNVFYESKPKQDEIPVKCLVCGSHKLEYEKRTSNVKLNEKQQELAQLIREEFFNEEESDE